MKLRYVDSIITKIRKHNEFFYEFFNVAVFVSYAGIIFILGIFSYTSYSLDLLQNFSISIPVMLSISFWLFCLYFYIICEIRFRVVQLLNIREHKKTNIITLVFSFIFTLLTILSCY